MQIELAPLCRAAGAELHVSAAVAIDTTTQQIELANGKCLPYDLVSLGIGSIPATNGMAIASDIATLVKPMQTLLGRLDEHLQEAVARCEQQSRALRVAIVGGGAAGVEIAFCLQRRLQIDFPHNDAELTIIRRVTYAPVGHSALGAVFF
jgi:selenide,water dikinase